MVKVSMDIFFKSAAKHFKILKLGFSTSYNSQEDCCKIMKEIKFSLICMSSFVFCFFSFQIH